MQVLLQIRNGPIPLLPDAFFVAQLFRQPLTAENFWIHPDHQHFLVIRTIENADPPAFRQMTVRAPEKIMLQFVGGRLFETENFAALWIDPGHDVPDGAVLSTGVHPLKDQQQRVAVGGIVKLLQHAQCFNVFFQELFISLLRFAKRLQSRRPFLEFDVGSGMHAEIL